MSYENRTALHTKKLSSYMHRSLNLEENSLSPTKLRLVGHLDHQTLKSVTQPPLTTTPLLLIPTCLFEHKLAKMPFF